MTLMYLGDWKRQLHGKQLGRVKDLMKCHRPYRTASCKHKNDLFTYPGREATTSGGCLSKLSMLQHKQAASRRWKLGMLQRRNLETLSQNAEMMPKLLSFSVHAGTGMTLTHWCNAPSIRFIGLLAWFIYIFHICTRDHAYSDRLQT